MDNNSQEITDLQQQIEEYKQRAEQAESQLKAIGTITTFTAQAQEQDQAGDDTEQQADNQTIGNDDSTTAKAITDSQATSNEDSTTAKAITDSQAFEYMRRLRGG